MRELIERMTRCGVPEITALCIANDFENRGRLNALAAYVVAVETEANHDGSNTD